MSPEEIIILYIVLLLQYYYIVYCILCLYDKNFSPLSQTFIKGDSCHFENKKEILHDPEIFNCEIFISQKFDQNVYFWSFIQLFRMFHYFRYD